MAWYAKFGDIEGSSQHKDHKGWCSAAVFNMGGHKAGGGGTGVARVGGKMQLEDVSIGIITDKALPKLIEAGVKGKVIEKVEIEGTATYGDAGQQTYLKVELKIAQITPYQLGALNIDPSTDDLSTTLNSG